jgi:hypothetical protein
MRRMIVVLIAVALAVGVFVFWPRTDVDDPPVTAAAGTTTTTTTEPLDTTTSTPSASTTLDDGSHVVKTEEEAEEILRELWFGWFEGIYNQDEDRIREVVATQHQLNLAREQFGTMAFEAPPQPSDIAYADTQILLATEQCTAISTNAIFTGFRTGSTSDVHILRWDNGRWKFFSLWAFEEDLWEPDCEASL